MGGIYDEWENPGTKESIYTFSLITTGANELTGYIHNAGQNPGRMPLIISREDEAAWLSHDLIRKDIETLMKPYPADLMDAYVIHNNFLRKDVHDASILEKV